MSFLAPRLGNVNMTYSHFARYSRQIKQKAARVGGFLFTLFRWAAALWLPSSELSEMKTCSHFRASADGKKIFNFLILVQ